jgi:UDP-N-acetyl-2-amino-2-deoxyglucuronate dehydrogenase
MNNPLQFAIVGCGRIAPRHAAQIIRHGILSAVCDIEKSKADALSKDFSSKAYYSIDDLLANEKQVDILVICTPNGLHAEHSIKALNAGMHVICEKPMAICVSDAEKMISAAEQNNKKLNIVKQNRFNPPVAFVKKLLDQQKLGRICSFQLNCFWNRPAEYYLNTWKGNKDMDGGTLFTQFSHFIDILFWFLGDIRSVTGMRKNQLHVNTIEFEDTGIALLEMNNGAIGSLNYSVNAYNHNMEGSLTLFGEKGTIKIGGQYLNELEYFLVENERAPVLQKGNNANEYGFYEGSMSNHDKVYDAFVNSINDNTSALASAQETLKTVSIIEKIYKESPFFP